MVEHEHEAGEEFCCGVCAHAHALETGQVEARARSGEPVRRRPGGSLWLLHGGRAVELDRFPFTVGRSPKLNDYANPRDDCLSRRVLSLEVDAQGYLLVTDMGSSCGSYLHDQPIRGTIRVQEGDEVLLGCDTRLTFTANAPG
jgi:pSer/pThr/pTyr-binding forkhead associated (FHA) protein